MKVDRQRIRNAWAGRISGCQLGKPIEVLSMTDGLDAARRYLGEAGALPLRDYIPLVRGYPSVDFLSASCKGRFDRSEPDDDINYTTLALMMLESHGAALTTTDVARAWLRWLPFGMVFTAERAAFTSLVNRSGEHFVFGADLGFDIAECSDNEYSDWIGAQIRSDLYGWVRPGQPEHAARLARADAQLSHRGEGVHGAVFVAAAGAAIGGGTPLSEAIFTAVRELPAESACAQAVEFSASLVGERGAVEKLHEHYAALSPVHTVNNLAVVVWALLSWPDDFSAAIGDAVAAGWDTDCNGATVGALWGLQGKPIPSHWTDPWGGRVAVTLAGVDELRLDDLVNRTVTVAESL